MSYPLFQTSNAQNTSSHGLECNLPLSPSNFLIWP
ncbi:hypothetical protein SNOG_01831 [Parastagonospora nodorum SN15]|uniref:Uncharacterized protein n=1 Tax=Phaeosphaeria nodorum (strain SN15 / ATCC MYA-4574 / FGSC 10173) TaxID=321614 RepID=Q0V2D3_PHANO|nr:hypothetical protein SNOG_01831 [Parastagonospora nodorum SN15]EAT91480.1 hypothetical protein SNOG_01831 [Parastagonospora nodorum SN15]